MKNTLQNNRLRGKNAERRVAKFFNSKRIGILGREDVETEKFIIEVKSRKSFSFEKFFNQLHKNNTKNKIELLFLLPKNKKLDDCYIVIKAKDFKKLFKEF